jgi:hypothetical protein
MFAAQSIEVGGLVAVAPAAAGEPMRGARMPILPASDQLDTWNEIS